MNLGSMWEKLADYQPHADKYGFGDEWLGMTTERTQEAACSAAKAALLAAPAVEAALAADAAYTAMKAAEQVITLITRAIELESKETASS